MKPLGLRPFAWTLALVRSRGKTREVYVCRIVRRPRRSLLRRQAIADSLTA